MKKEYSYNVLNGIFSLGIRKLAPLHYTNVNSLNLPVLYAVEFSGCREKSVSERKFIAAKFREATIHRKETKIHSCKESAW